MARIPKPWFRDNRQAWFVTIRGERHNLGPNEQEAKRRFHELMAQKPKPKPTPKPDGLSVAGLFDKFLDWSQKNQAAATYEWYRTRIQSFINHLEHPAMLPAVDLRPYHVQEWVDAHSDWGSTFRHGAIASVQRAYNWAVELGYLNQSPVRAIKKPPSKRREQAVTPEQWRQVYDRYPKGDPFLDLLEFCWETGCRPYEARMMEPAHVHLDRLCVLFPPEEAKGKKRWRIIRLTKCAAEILKRRLEGRNDGKVFVNADGRPWTAYAINCRFCRLQKHTGIKHFAYSWRHGFATRKLIAGHDHLTVAELLGHADGTMLAKVYAHLDQADDHLRKVLEG